jgi:anti-sigma factor RsiW
VKQIRDEELSALIDGELDPPRSEEVRARINADPALRERFDALMLLDRRLSLAAEQAAFVPQLSFFAGVETRRPILHGRAAIILVLALLVVRLLPKFAALELIGTGLHLAAVGAVAFIVIVMAGETAGRSGTGATRAAA